MAKMTFFSCLWSELNWENVFQLSSERAEKIFSVEFGRKATEKIFFMTRAAEVKFLQAFFVAKEAILRWILAKNIIIKKSWQKYHFRNDFFFARFFKTLNKMHSSASTALFKKNFVLNSCRKDTFLHSQWSEECNRRMVTARAKRVTISVEFGLKVTKKCKQLK